MHKHQHNDFHIRKIAHSAKDLIKMIHKNTAQNHWNKFRLCSIVGIALIQITLFGCAASDKTVNLELTPITTSPTGINLHGKFVWDDLLTNDVAQAKDFYGQLLGWTFEQRKGYTVVYNDGQAIGGMAQVTTTPENPGVARWLNLLSVEDLDHAVALVEKNGGSIVNGPLNLLNRGRGALIRDPNGAQLLLVHATDGDPEDQTPPIGSWLWHELWSNDIDGSLAFYQQLIGYDFEGDKDNYLILLKDNNWRAGIRVVSDPTLEMRWVPVVRVADTEKTAEQAKTLGGKVVVEPRPTEDGGSVALLSDPSGALFIIQRWSPASSEGDL